jgi:hypothetical protein
MPASASAARGLGFHFVIRGARPRLGERDHPDAGHMDFAAHRRLLIEQRSFFMN